jgi:sugar lactone lactonase YvrE
MNRLPVGTVTFVGDAWPTPCAQIDPNSYRPWLSDPEAANINTTTVPTIHLVLRPNGRAGISGDFEGNIDAGTTAHLVTTVAGVGGARGSVDGIGPNARFNQTSAVALDTAGNLYVADTYNETIRKIVLATEQVTTWAGQLGNGGSADGIGGAATVADPSALCSDATNLYVLGSDQTVRKIAFANAQVTTVAGTAGQTGTADGTGAAARFNAPAACVADGAGNLYIADSGNLTIRQIVLATGVVTTIAGAAGQSGNVDAAGAAARFGSPAGLAFAAGALYISDAGNATIRKMVLAGGAVTTIAGTGANGSADGAAKTAATFSSPGALAVDATGALWIAETYADTIRMLDPTATNVRTVAGVTLFAGTTDGNPRAARFRNPNGLAIDAQGNIYVADSSNSTIRKM